MPRSLPSTAAAIFALLLAATAWLPPEPNSAPLAFAKHPAMATYQLPLAA